MGTLENGGEKGRQKNNESDNKRLYGWNGKGYQEKY